MVDVTRNTGPAFFTASLAAGPVAIATIGLSTLLSGQPVSIVLDPNVIVPMVGSGALLCVIAMIVAMVPNIIGVTVMSWLASRNVGLRHPAIWALAGAATLGIPTWLCLDSDPGHAFIASWATIGALSAVIGRSRLWWDDPATA